MPLTFPHNQTFGDPLDYAKLPAHIQLAFCNVAKFPIEVHNNLKFCDLHAFQTQFNVDIFGGCESNLNWKCMPPGGCLYNGSAPITLSVQSLATIPTMTLADNNMVAPSFWEMVRLPLLSLLLGWIPQVLGTGFGLFYLDGWESPHASSVPTSPVTLLLSKLTVSVPSINLTS